MACAEPGLVAPGLIATGFVATDEALVIAQSGTGRRWRMPRPDERRVAHIVDAHGLPDLIARLLVHRGVATDEVPHFLDPRLRALLPDPAVLRDMDRAAERLALAVRRGERIGILADYDVDGATSSAILARYLRMVGAETALHIPDRMAEGYGPNAGALARLQGLGCPLVVTLDCGVTAFEALEAGAGLGLDLIVLDHHAAEPRLPKALAVVNPNRRDQAPGLGDLAAVGVTFLALVALNRELRAAGWFVQRAEPDLIQFLDLVALGTVCDVVPLRGLNRAFVAQGLKVAARRTNPGLTALLDRSKIAEPPTAWHFGFLVGPRINAGGRIGRSDLGSRLLATENAGEAAGIALELDRLNVERREIESRVLKEARAQIAARTVLDDVVVAAGEGWHPGVVGIVASRLVERLNRPVCVVALNDGQAKGSGRSIAGIDLGAAIIAARHEGLLTAGGGHRMAAGLTMAAERVGELAAFLSAHAQSQSRAEAEAPTLHIEASASVTAAAQPDLAALMARLAPFGQGNEEPRVMVAGCVIRKLDVVGQSHLRAYVADPAGGPRLKAMAFRSVGEPLGEALHALRDRRVHLTGKLKLDRWNGIEESVLTLEDIAAAD